MTVRAYDTLNGAGAGFARLRSSAGLHCSVTTSVRAEAEGRARALSEWLAGLVGAHPAVGAMVVQALVDVTDGEDVLRHGGDVAEVSSRSEGGVKQRCIAKIWQKFQR